MVKGNVVRSAKIQSIVKKMESYSDGESHQINRNPVTHKFSTYYKRTERVGGTLLNTDEIATKYININVDEHNDENEQYISSMLQCNLVNDDDEEEEDEVGAESENNTNIRRSRRNQNHKKAKKYVAPPEELTRLQIREDFRKMRNPKMHEIKMILKTLGIGFEDYIDHKAYSFDPSTNYQQEEEEEDDVYMDHDDDDVDEDDDEDAQMNEELDDIQFIGMQSKHKKKKKKKRKRNHYEYEQHEVPQNSAFIINGHQTMNGEEPHRKKQKIINNNSEAIKCRKCNKIFTLEVDLLLHKTNDHCTN